MQYNGSDKHKKALFDNKQDKLVAGENVTLTPQQDGTVKIDASGGGDVTDVQIDGTTILDENGVANIETMTGATSQANGTKGLVPAPTSADKDKVLKGDGTWCEAGGNVDDVYMNGQSIVGQDKIARFSNYVELTRAEYDALPDTKYTDGILYCIKDSGSSNADYFSPVVYSLAEREIGVWIDGKPLYQKSYFVPNPVYLTTTGSGTPSFSPTAVQDATMASIDKVVSITGHWTRHSDYGSGSVYDLVYPINSWESTNAFRSLVRVNTTAPSQAEIGWNYCIYTDNNISIAKNLFVTIQYTKTTDVAGSGKWGQDGVPAVHYSTSERVIGTWIDGSTLYEKTYAPVHLNKNVSLEVDNFVQTENIIVSMDFVWCPGWNFIADSGVTSNYHYWSIQPIGCVGYNENVSVNSPQVKVQENKLRYIAGSQDAGVTIMGSIRYVKKHLG